MQCHVPLIDNKFAVIKNNEDGVFDYCSDKHARRVITKREDSFVCTKVVKWPSINVLNVSPKFLELPTDYITFSKYQSYIREVHTPVPCTFVYAKKKTHFVCNSKPSDHNLLIDSTDEGLIKYENGSWDFKHKFQVEDKILHLDIKNKIAGIYSNSHEPVPTCEVCQGQIITTCYKIFNPHVCENCQHVCQFIEKVHHKGKIYDCENQIKYKSLLYGNRMANIDNRLFIASAPTVHCRQFPDVRLYEIILF